jgi:hypothetical protein
MAILSRFPLPIAGANFQFAKGRRMTANSPTYEDRSQQHRPTDPQTFARAAQELQRAGLTPSDIGSALRITTLAAEQLLTEPSRSAP